MSIKCKITVLKDFKTASVTKNKASQKKLKIAVLTLKKQGCKIYSRINQEEDIWKT